MAPMSAASSKHGHGLERDEVLREDRVADRRGVERRVALAHLDVAEAVDERVAHDTEQQEGDEHRHQMALFADGVVDAEFGPREHDAEEEQHDDGADVDEHLRDADELGAEQQELRRDPGEHDHEVERGVDDVLGRHHAHRGDDHQRGDHAERDVLRDHHVAAGIGDDLRRERGDHRGTFLTLA